MICLSFSAPFYATTWSDKQISCPVCQTANTFQAPMSWGSYIYYWPSKFQMIFWPMTTSYFTYSCKKCYYSAYMYDFLSQVKLDNLDKIKEALKSVEIKRNEEDNYHDISSSLRLQAAEKVYLITKKNHAFWSEFYRVMAYHYTLEKKYSEAKKAREKALKYIDSALAQKDNIDEHREYFIVRGGIKFFLQDLDGALVDFRVAKDLKYANKKLPQQQVDGYNHYLDILVKEYIDLITTTQKKAIEELPENMNEIVQSYLDENREKK